MRLRPLAECNVFDHVIKTDDYMGHPEAALTYQHFVLIKHRLYRVSRDTLTEEEHTQLLVPKSHQEITFQEESALSLSYHTDFCGQLFSQPLSK